MCKFFYLWLLIVADTYHHSGVFFFLGGLMLLLGGIGEWILGMFCTNEICYNVVGFGPVNY